MAAQADRDDRLKPIAIEADKPCTVDLARLVTLCAGNVLVQQGTLQLRAERIELREVQKGWRQAFAIGQPGAPARYRQRRDGGDEWVEGQAERIEYDSRAGVLRLLGDAQIRRVRDGRTLDEILGGEITWDSTAEVFSVAGGAATAANPTGRVRAVLSAPDPAPPASAPAAAPTGSRR